MPDNRHDRRDPAADEHGQRKILYPEGSKAHPTIVETFTARKTAKDKSVDFGDAHPDTAAFPAAVLVQAEATKGDERDKMQTDVFETLPGVPITTTRVDEDGMTVTVTRQRMAVADIVTEETLSAGIWTRKWKGEGNAVAAVQMTESRAVPGNVISGGEFYDPVTDTVVSETRQLVAYNAATPSITSLYTDYRALPNSYRTKWQIARTYPSGVTSKTIIEHEADNYTYPALMSSVATATLTKLSDETLFKVTPIIEAERPLEITRKITKTFTTTEPSNATIMADLYPIRPVRHRYNGVLFDLVTGPVICDANAGLTATTGTDDPIFGTGVVETYAWSASTPSYSNYTSARTAGDWKMVTPRKSKKLAAGLWMLIKEEIPIL